MDSKIPKPSGLKPPTVLDKNFFDFKQFTENLAKKPELKKQLSEFNFTRSRSPDIGTAKTKVQPKLRRSKSTADLMSHRRGPEPMKRFQPTLDPIPSKRTKPNTSTQSSTSRVAAPAQTKKPVPGKENHSTRPATTSLVNRKPLTGAVKSTTTAAATKSNAASTSTNKSGASSKNIARQVPKYDYKTRFAILEEKHKTLKQKYENVVEDVAKFENMVEENEQFKFQIEELKAENDSLKETVEDSAAKITNLQKIIDALTASLSSTTEELKVTKETLEKTDKELKELTETHNELVKKSGTLEKDYNEATEMLSAAQTQLHSINYERKVLHNQVLDLKGNIRVFARVRPPLESETDKKLCDFQFTDEASLEIYCHEKKQGFGFDYVFNPISRQEEIFEMVSPLIQSALDGYNVCIFAYGQTGSGKTFTMDGASEKPGIIPRTTQLLFNSVKDALVLGWKYQIKASFLEIYNEVLYDLLAPESTNIEIRMANAASKTEITITNLLELEVDSPARLYQLMDMARKNRATAATAGNERSSRSHAVTRIHLKGTHQQTNEVVLGQINLVDLAGSESPKTSVNMDETKNINRSLSELSNVILALVQRNEHVPYRNSKLTHLLMPCLGGNSKTLMFVNVAPFQDCYVETTKSLRFAAQVNSCKMAKAKKNKQLNVSSVF